MVHLEIEINDKSYLIENNGVVSQINHKMFY